MDKKIGLYIHIPFCLKKCNYCDFVSFTDCFDRAEKYVDAVISEASKYKGLSADTVFIGGGTPTSLSADLLVRLIEGVKKSISFSRAVEFSVEANPKTLTEEKCEALKNAGVNRLSIGVQSFIDDELKMLGRVHNSSCAKDTIELSKKYFENINIDIMTGLPSQTMENVIYNINEAIRLGASHISAYSLIVEDGTRLKEMLDNGDLQYPDEDLDRDIYHELSRVLEQNEFEHYEISNFAKADRECKHNLKYWRAEEYIGLGLSAHSYFDGKRFYNTSNLDEYLENPITPKGEEELTENDKISEYNMLSLRTKYGINKAEFRKRFGAELCEIFGKEIKRFTSLGLLAEDDEKVLLTKKGLDVSNSIMSEFIL